MDPEPGGNRYDAGEHFNRELAPRSYRADIINDAKRHDRGCRERQSLGAQWVANENDVVSAVNEFSQPKSRSKRNVDPETAETWGWLRMNSPSSRNVYGSQPESKHANRGRDGNRAKQTCEEKNCVGHI